MSPCTRDKGLLARTRAEDTQSTQLCPPEYADKMSMFEDKATALPSSGEDISMGADKLSVIDNTNTPSLDTMHQPEASTTFTRPDGDTAPGGYSIRGQDWYAAWY